MDEKERLALRKFKRAVLVAGAVFSLLKALPPIIGGQLVFALTFVCWSMLPYAIYAVFAWRSDRAQSVVLAGGMLAAMDLVANIFVFYFINTKLKVSVLVFVPVWLSIFVLPAGYLVGWLAERVAAWKESGGPTHPS